MTLQEEYIQSLGSRAKSASKALYGASAGVRNKALLAVAEALEQQKDKILAANAGDIAAGEAAGTSSALLDRLRLTKERIAGIAQGVREVADLPDPVGKVLSGETRPNGLRIVKTTVPMGVVGMIYEARPNVTVDAAALCLKSANACLLRGGKEAIRSNKVLADIMREAVEKAGLPSDVILLVEDTSRETATAMMRLNGCLDLLIPRGGAGLIQSVVQNATVPVIETGVGNCHIYVDETAEIEQAVSILVNAKTSRPSVCNAAETVLCHKAAAEEFLPKMARALKPFSVELRGCPETRRILGSSVVPADEEDYATEFLDFILAVRVVSSLDEALAHIAQYTTHHSEAIVTRDYESSQRFLQEVDAAAVYVNASTRFTDGGVFGLGAEIGISTQKLHARGPMGLEALTTWKYLIYGNGQIR